MDDGVLRRSLRRMNPFKSKLFRLPATPRLTRKAPAGNGEDVVTEWNFERTASTRSSARQLTRASSPDTLSLPIAKAPPAPSEAEQSIHAHMRTLLSGPSTRESRLQQLPTTRYAPDGHVSEAMWNGDFSGFDSSPHNSTMSLLNTGRRNGGYETNGMSYSRTRPSYPMNGLSRPPSTEPGGGGRRGTAVAHPTASSSSSHSHSFSYPDTSSSSSLRLPPVLFTLNQQCSSTQLEETLIAREWVFREIYQSAVVEKVPLSVICGAKGSGKSAIFNQLVLNSPFYMQTTSDTLDSGCVLDSSPSLPSRNYEWLRAVGGRVVAYHTCTIQSAASCSIPEFVCNLSAMLAASPVLKSYALILDKKPELHRLVHLEECLRHDSLDVFRRAVAEPLAQLKSTDQGSLVVLLDGVDEAEFHRCEDGRSIGAFLNQVLPMLPSWMRLVITSDEDGLAAVGCDSARIIRIDDYSLDERVLRDNRMFVEYRISMVRELEDPMTSYGHPVSDTVADFAERVVARAQGNMLYMRLLLQLLETGRVNISSLLSNDLPQDIHQLYSMYMDLTFTSNCPFERVSPILDVLLASPRPLSRQSLLEILNVPSANQSTDDHQLSQSLTILSPLLSFSSNDVISLHHSAFRDWLLSHNSMKYHSDARKGHILLALWLSSKAPLEPSRLMELAHHLLKAHPYKYMNGEYAPELTSSKDGQILWIQKSSEDVAAALLDDRNMQYPNTKVTRLLLVAGADPSYCPPSSIVPSSTVTLSDSTVPLSVSQRAVAAGHWALVSLLLHYGAGLHPDSGPPLLSIAARCGHADLMRQLHILEGGVATMETVIEAAGGGHSQIVSYLLSSSWPPPRDKSRAVEEAVKAAARAGHVSICQQLVDSFPSIDIDSAMREACEHGRATVVQFFLSRGASLCSLSWPDDKPALHCAVESGSWDLVVAVLSLPGGSALEQLDSYGRTPLQSAARCGHVGLVDMLVNKGANVDHRDASGNTALMLAVRQGHLACAQLLIDRHADMTGVDKEGNTLAHFACAHASRAMMDRLLEAGLLFEERDGRGERPIETAIRMKNRPALEALLRRGARLRQSTWQAAKEDDPEALMVLLNKLLDDAAILFRKKRMDDAMHRLHYALDKCQIYLADESLAGLSPQFHRIKCHLLLATARVHRRSGHLERALATCHEAAAEAGDGEALFEVLLLRAKCHFDCHAVDRARADARAAAQLRPNCEEARHLLDTLSLPTTNISRF